MCEKGTVREGCTRTVFDMFGEGWLAVGGDGARRRRVGGLADEVLGVLGGKLGPVGEEIR